MTTAALLPTSGDARLARYWCNNYERVWRGEVDELHVLVNGSGDGGDVFRSVGAHVTVTDKLGHGQALDILVRDSAADAVVILEDDAFVRVPGAIRSRLERITSGADEVIGCPRGGMSPELHMAAIAKWGPEPEGPDTSHGYGIWPCFLFGRPTDFRAVRDHRWESLSWHAGDTVPGVEYPVTGQTLTTDTATIMAFQLRERHRISLDVNYKEMWQKDFDTMHALTGEPPYFHAGGMMNELPEVGRPGIGMESNEGRDWAHRLWWRRRVGLDDSADAARMQVDPDYWTGKAEPWINWHE